MLAPVILVVSALFLVALHFMPFIRNLFQLQTITRYQFWICFTIAFASVMWIEIYKLLSPAPRVSKYGT
jgi:hypothetical protein